MPDGSSGNANEGHGLRSALASPPVPRRRVFVFVGRGDPLMLLLPFKAMFFGRAGKSGRPPPLEPSLKVHRDIAHTQSSGFAVAPPGQRPQRARAFKGPSKNGVSRNQRWRTVRWKGSTGTMKPAAAGLTGGLPRVTAGPLREHGPSKRGLDGFGKPLQLAAQRGNSR
jgi:hypothetical protein